MSKCQLLHVLAPAVCSIGLHGPAFARQPDTPKTPTTIPTLCPEWFKNEYMVITPTRPCPGYTSDTLDRIEFVVNDAVGGWKWCPKQVSKVFPAPPIASRKEIETRLITDDSGKLVGKIDLDPPQGDAYMRTWATSYQLPSGWIYHFGLHRVPKAEQQRVLKALQSIERTILFGQFNKRKTPPSSGAKRDPRRLPFFIESDYLARYDRVYNLTDKETREGFYIPQDWTDGLKGESLVKLWAECAIPIDADWFPTGDALRSVIPIALQTSADLYLVSQEVRPQRAFGGTFDHFEGRIFDLSGSHDLAKAFDRIAGSLRAELSASFADRPLSAEPVLGLAPNQIRFTRRFQESQVLSTPGAPRYELSTYTILMWPGPSGAFMGAAEGYFDIYGELEKGKQDQVFLQVSHSLQLSSEKNGNYPEPSSDDYLRYQAVVRQALEKSVARVTNQYHGSIVKAGDKQIGKIRLPD